MEVANRGRQKDDNGRKDSGVKTPVGSGSGSANLATDGVFVVVPTTRSGGGGVGFGFGQTVEADGVLWLIWWPGVRFFLLGVDFGWESGRVPRGLCLALGAKGDGGS